MTRRLGLAAALATAVLLGASGCSSDRRTVLTVYSPHGKDLLTYFEQEFEKAHPDIDVQFVDMGSQEVLDRLRAEKANPQADVWFGAPSEIFDRAASEGLLDAYKPTWANVVPADAHDPGDLWYGTYMTPEVIAYSADAVDSAAAPQDWDDVLDPKWNQQIIIRDPVASGSMRAIWGAILIRSIKTTGNTAAGWQWLRTLDAHTKEYTLDGTMMMQKLGRLEGKITLFDMPDIAGTRQRDSVHINYLIPKSGTPLIVDAIAVVKGSKHAAEARAYYEFVTTREAILEASKRFNRIPLRPDIDVAALPEWIRSVRPLLKPMPLDRQLIADSLNTWMTYWDANVRNRGRKQ